MLDKTWRYKEALVSYEQALQRDPGCFAAFYGRGEMLRQLSRPKEALAVYDEILHLDSTSAKAYGEKGWVLASMRLYDECQAMETVWATACLCPQQVEYILALKITAGRQKDLDDCAILLPKTKIRTRQQAQQLLDRYILPSGQQKNARCVSKTF